MGGSVSGEKPLTYTEIMEHWSRTTRITVGFLFSMPAYYAAGWAVAGSDLKAFGETADVRALTTIAAVLFLMVPFLKKVLTSRLEELPYPEMWLMGARRGVVIAAICYDVVTFIGLVMTILHRNFTYLLVPGGLGPVGLFLLIVRTSELQRAFARRFPDSVKPMRLV